MLLICLQLGSSTSKRRVSAFSLGLAITMVGIGRVVAWGVHHASAISSPDRLLRRLPLASVGLVAVLGLITLWKGLADLVAPAMAVL